VKLRLALFVAAASGFVALSYEILWYRLCSYATQGGPVAFGALLGFYLIGLAVGSYASRAYCEERDVSAARRALGRFLLLATAVAFLVAPAMGWVVTVGPWVLTLLVVLPATTLLGAVLPLTSHLAIAPDDHAGARLSYLYLANIIGSCAGSLVTGFVAMDCLSVREIAVGIAWLGLVLSAVVLVATEPRRRILVATLGAVVGVAAAVGLASHAAFDQIYERLLYGKDFMSNTRFAQTVENRSGVINVTEDGRVFGGGVYDGAFNTSLVHDQNLVVRAYAVSAMHPRPKRMLMVGLASGSWAKVLAAAPGLEHLTIVEINPGYLPLIATHAEVSGILRDPKVEIVIDDGRRWLEAHPRESFDAIVMNTTWHWRAHATNLLSREFFDIVRRHLATGGVFFFNTTWSADACKTALVVFPHALRVSNFIAGSDAPLAIDPVAWRALLEGYRIDGHPVLDLTSEVDRETLEKLVAYAEPGGANRDVEEAASLWTACAVGDVITDDNMLPEFRRSGARPKP
jgi:spermidine synthase